QAGFVKKLQLFPGTNENYSSFFAQKCKGCLIMGKRRSKRKPPARAKLVQPLSTRFNCPFCNHQDSCECKMDRDRNIGTIICYVCGETYQTHINYLLEPIDVYNDWIDACEQANQ
ncbi:Transcription elongation factor 1 -like protein, partial [Trichinella britovi]